MRILVTRPQPGADETAARLRTMGHDVLVQPLTRIVFNPRPAIPVAPGAIAFTSPNAVRAVLAWDAARHWRGLPVFAVGVATAGAASDAGFADVRTAEGDVARLAATIGASLDPAAGALLYPAARDRAGDLGAALTAAGIAVTTVEAYHAVAAGQLDPVVVDAIRAGRIDAVLFHSRRSAAVFADLIAAAGLLAALKPTRLFALSARVAEPLRPLAADSLAIAASPDETALLALVGSRPEDGRGPIHAV